MSDVFFTGFIKTFEYYSERFFFYFTLADAKEESITTTYFKRGGRIDDSKVRKNVSACDLLRQLKGSS